MSKISLLPDTDHGYLESHTQWEPQGGTGVYKRPLHVWRNFKGKWTPCDLLIFLDGQNLFRQITPSGRPHWDAEKRFHQWQKPLLAVGVPASKRRYPEYVGWSKEPGHFSPTGDKHADFLVHFVLPYLKAQYPRARLKGLLGASAGGVAALYTAWSFPGKFPAVCCLSAGRHYFEELLSNFDDLPAKKIYLSCGDRGMDKSFLGQSKHFAQQLKKRGGGQVLTRWHRGFHCESVWGRRLPDLLKFTLQKQS